MKVITMIRTYSEMIKYKTFRERFNYLKLNGQVGSETFGYDRYLNQVFYKSYEWKRIRNQIIVRDNGCDLGVDGYDIYDKIIIHHMNPIMLSDIHDRNPDILNPEFLVCVSHDTHNGIHYGDETLLRPYEFAERKMFDTSPWKEIKQ